MDKIRVLIVEDSSLIRMALKSILEGDPSMEVIGEARNGFEGIEKAALLKPSVITMDLKMAQMGGLEAIAEIMEKTPTPIVVVSSLDVDVIVQALGVGAMDFVALTGEMETIAPTIIEKVRIASRVNPIRHVRVKPAADPVPPRVVEVGRGKKVFAIGISTGGPQALRVILSGLPKDFPAPILVVQHISQGFVEGLADWLRDLSALDIRVARAGEVLADGTVFFAPDGVNMGVTPTGEIVLKEDISRKMMHVPAIDALMESVAIQHGPLAVGILMTGMGSDGVEGMAKIKSSGGTTLAQDEATSAVFGMNRLAIIRGHVQKVVPLERIADEMIRIAQYTK